MVAVVVDHCWFYFNLSFGEKVIFHVYIRVVTVFGFTGVDVVESQMYRCLYLSS